MQHCSFTLRSSYISGWTMFPSTSRRLIVNRL